MSSSLHLTPTIYRHELDENENRGTRTYLISRLGQIKEMQEALELEVRALNVLLPLIEDDLCTECKGQKSFWIHTSQDEGYWQTCKACGGSGISNDE